MGYELTRIGRIISSLTNLEEAPRQPDEGAPGAWVELEPAVSEALQGLVVGDEIVVLTWLDAADRRTLTIHPRGDPSRGSTGVFATRSPHRPNPIGIHATRIAEIAGRRVRVSNMEAIDGTPVVDIKIALPADPSQR